MQLQKASPYASLIATATGAPQSRLALLENLMRDEVFHSTLDWQSAEELAEGARRAHDLYRSAPGYYDGLELLHLAEIRVAQLETRLERARAAADPLKTIEMEAKLRLARESARTAREAVPRLADFYGLSRNPPLS